MIPLTSLSLCDVTASCQSYLAITNGTFYPSLSYPLPNQWERSENATWEAVSLDQLWKDSTSEVSFKQPLPFYRVGHVSIHIVFFCFPDI